MAIEIMLNAGKSRFYHFCQILHILSDGQIIVFFVITVAACEAAIGLAIILLVFRQKKTIKTEDIQLNERIK